MVKEEDWISISGTTGQVYKGKINTRPSEVLQVMLEGSLKTEDSETFRTYDRIMTWADKHRRLGVRTNADHPRSIRASGEVRRRGDRALPHRAHVFLGDRIRYVRQMILAESEEARRKALDKLLPMQREDFQGIFEAMGGRPVTVRTLDPPLHEFLPHGDADIASLAKDMGVSS